MRWRRRSNANLVLFLALARGVRIRARRGTILVGQNMGRARHRGRAPRDGNRGRAVRGRLTRWWRRWAGLAAPAILHLLATPPASVPLAEAYLRVIFIGMPGSFTLVIITMGMRGTGDSMTPFFIMESSTSLLDSGLNPVFIRGLGGAPALGIAGSATATAVAAYVSLVRADRDHLRTRSHRSACAVPNWRWLIPDVGAGEA